jgi:deazaflavin-dependent oxidoreductase (nitroreductase family)
MSDPLDWNAKTIAEFRANEGRVGGNFEGAPMVLVHHRGRKSGREYVNPMMYLPHDTEPDIIYVFATKAGAPTNPDWYNNLAAAGNGSVERGTETYKVTVRELTGAERDRIYAEQARRYPGFAEYARQTAGVRIIPVLELTRALAHVPMTERQCRFRCRGSAVPARWPRGEARRRGAVSVAGRGSRDGAGRRLAWRQAR